MKDLIEALNIFLKYNPDNSYPFQCEHDELFICGVSPEDVSAEDIHRLEELGFSVNDCDGFSSYRYGSA